MKIKCPKCGSKNVGQYRQLTGPIWCEKCGYRVEQKEINKEFYIPEASDKPKCNGSCKCCCKK